MLFKEISPDEAVQAFERYMSASETRCIQKIFGKHFALFVHERDLRLSFSAAFYLYDDIVCVTCLTGEMPSYKALNEMQIGYFVFDSESGELSLRMGWCFEEKMLVLNIPTSLYDLHWLTGHLGGGVEVFSLLPRSMRRGDMEYQENRC